MPSRINGGGGTQKQKAKQAGRALDLRVIMATREGNYGVWTSRIIRYARRRSFYYNFKTTFEVRAHSSRLRLRSVSSATLTFSTLTSVALPSLSLLATAFCNAN